MNRGWLIALVLASMFVGSAPAHAVSSVYLDIRASASAYDIPSGTETVDASPNNNVFTQSDPVLGVNASHIESRFAGSGTGFASGSAIANPAGVHVATNLSASASASETTNGGGGGNTDVQAAMGDSFALLVPGIPLGDPITVTALWYTSGSVSASFAEGGEGVTTASAYSVWNANFALIPFDGEGYYATRSAGCQHDTVAQACWGDDFGTDAPAVLTVPNGSSLTVSISARVRAWGGASQSGTGSSSMNAFANLGDTVAWGGIASVKDAEDNDLAAYTALSPETGYDYRFAYVPEPQMPALFAAAIAGLFFVSRLRAS